MTPFSPWTQAPQEKGYFVLNDILRVIPAAASSPPPVEIHSNGNIAVPVEPVAPVAAAQAAIAAAAAPPVAPAVVPQELQQPSTPLAAAPTASDNAKQQATPPRPAAAPAAAAPPAAAANLTYAQRVKLSSTPVQSPAPAAMSSSEAAEHRERAHAEANGGPVAAPAHAPRRGGGGGGGSADSSSSAALFGIFFRPPLDTNLTTAEIEAEFAKYGPILGGSSGISIVTQKFGGNKSVRVSTIGIRTSVECPFSAQP